MEKPPLVVMAGLLVVVGEQIHKPQLIIRVRVLV